jgi:NTE family protein
MFMGFGIALSGGGARGAAHVGVMCALEEAGLLPTSIAGTSAGSIVAGLYALGMMPHEMREKAKELARVGAGLVDPDYMGMYQSTLEVFRGKPITFSGFLKGDKLEKYLDTLTEGKNIKTLRMRTIFTAVDLYSRQTIAFVNTMDGVRPYKNTLWKTNVKMSEAIHASCAVPAYFQPKMMGGMCLVDGGVTDVVPVDLLISAGEPNVLAVDVSENYPLTGNPGIIDVCSHSLSILMSLLSEYRASGERLMLTPRLPETAHVLSFGEIEACMDAGYQAAKDAMPQIKRLFRDGAAL